MEGDGRSRCEQIHFFEIEKPAAEYKSHSSVVPLFPTTGGRRMRARTTPDGRQTYIHTYSTYIEKTPVTLNRKDKR